METCQYHGGGQSAHGDMSVSQRRTEENRVPMETCQYHGGQKRTGCLNYSGIFMPC